jgi:hypothetical protein
LEFAIVILNVFSHGAIEIQSIETNKVFKINGHRFNLFVENFKGIVGKKIKLVDPIYKDALSEDNSV